MELNQATSTAPQIGAVSAADKSLTGLGNDLNTFMTLLTTQLQNQDPLNPMDSKDMTNQLVQFASVEQQIRTGQHLENLVNLQTASADAAIVSYIGHNATVKGDRAPLGTDGIKFGYEPAKSADAVTLRVVDAKTGATVYQTEGNTSRSRHEFAWDGKDADGNRVADGDYRLKVGAVDKDGQKIDVNIDVTSQVTGVQSGENGPEILLGTNVFGVNDVKKVSLI